MAETNGRGREQFSFSPAVREAISVKMTIAAVSGAGKTIASLLMAYGLCGRWERIAVADTENGRSLYAVGQRFGDVEIGQFMHCPIAPPYSPRRLTELVRQCGESGNFDVLVIDSLSKEWEGQGGTLEAVENAGAGANKFAAWKVPGDEHRRFIDAVQFSSMDVICTMRKKPKYDQIEQEKNGKTVMVPVKRGMEPIARAGTEYEFDLAWSLERDGQVFSAFVDKDNTCLFGADAAGPITVAHGQRIREWVQGAASQIGSPEWVERRLTQFAEYSGSADGLKTLIGQIAAHKARLRPEDLERLRAARAAAELRMSPDGQIAAKAATRQ